MTIFVGKKRTVDNKIQMVDLRSQYLHIKSEIDQAIEEVINSSAYINGPQVKEFCENLATYLKAKHVVPCANGTDALQISLMALDLQPGDEVITVPFTFVATAEVIGLLKLTPVFVDVDPQTFNMDVDQVEQVITNKTKCIIPVHLFGQSVHMEPLLALAEKHGIAIIEDNAQSIGGDYYFEDGSSKKAGTLGTIGCTSFYPAKNLGAFGDGGAIFTNDDDIADQLRLVTNHGSKERYYYDIIGVNSRLDGIQAAVLNSKLKHLDEYIIARQQAAVFYDKAFEANEDIETPFRAPYSSHVFHQYSIKVNRGYEDIKEELKSKSIPFMIYYPVPLHLSKAYKSYGYDKGDFPVSEKLSQKLLSLPMHTELSNDQLSYITESVNELLTIK